MFEHKTIRWIVLIAIVGILVYVLILLKGEDGRSILFHPVTPQQEYVTADVDSAIERRNMRRANNANERKDTIIKYESNVSFIATSDSDSLAMYEVHRETAHAVNLDLTEEKEHVFFTWDDITAYFRFIGETIGNIFNKKK
ncbi:MAG: hypothetical protein MJZ75_04115 [Paludibacteraceae bacterium]|nr:hypothetical protein [Paludibacteraceae bacterium]